VIESEGLWLLLCASESWAAPWLGFPQDGGLVFLFGALKINDYQTKNRSLF
jgi:hypothetical protein